MSQTTNQPKTVDSSLLRQYTVTSAMLRVKLLYVAFTVLLVAFGMLYATDMQQSSGCEFNGDIQRLSTRMEDVRSAEEYAATYGIELGLALKIQDAADATGVRREIAFALVREESSFRRNAVSHVGAIGLAQVMPATAAWFAPDLNVRDPEQNLYIGFGYLAMLIERYQDELTALVAYNVGPTRVDRHGIRPYTGSVGYANRILGGA